jgi:hypothetical protein
MATPPKKTQKEMAKEMGKEAGKKAFDEGMGKVLDKSKEFQKIVKKKGI